MTEEERKKRKKKQESIIEAEILKIIEKSMQQALQKALDENLPITDDCSAVEALGMSVYLTEGSDENIKVTTPTDLILADAIWKKRNQS